MRLRDLFVMNLKAKLNTKTSKKTPPERVRLAPPLPSRRRPARGRRRAPDLPRGQGPGQLPDPERGGRGRHAAARRQGGQRQRLRERKLRRADHHRQRQGEEDLTACFQYLEFSFIFKLV